MSAEERAGGDLKERIRRLLETEADEISILHLLDRGEVDAIAPFFDLRRVPSGAVIVAEGEEVNFLGIIAAGKVEARHRPTIGERPLTIAHLEEGAHIGGIAPGRRSAMATLVAEEETELLVLSPGSFDSLAERYPATAVKLLKGVIEVLTIRLESAIDRVVLFF